METGTIRLFNKEQGFGIIICAKGTEYNFFFSGLQDVIDVGDGVTFDIEETSKGILAINIQKISIV